MPLVPMLQETKLTKEQQLLVDRFLEASGYGYSDILSVSYSTRTFLIRNGGKYRLVGRKIRHLAGPPADLEDRWEL